MPASVAPPMATSSTPSGSFERRPSGTQSPETRANRRPAAAPGPSSSITSSRAGAEFHTVTPRDETSSRHADASRRSSSSGSTTAAPNERAPKMSNTERSKSRADTPRTASPGPMPHRRTTSAMVFHAAAWLTATPFGTPVEPDV